jgi:hypothetical protein
MPLEQIENPPGAREHAPQGEIRQEPTPTLRRFSLFIAAAVVLPAIALVVVGLELGRTSLAMIGVILLVGLTVPFFVILFQMMKSRKTGRSERFLQSE